MKYFTLIATGIVLSACNIAGAPDGVAPPLECQGSGGASDATSTGTLTPWLTRLRAYYRIADEDVRIDMPERWFDSLRAEDCRWRESSDGTERCLPDAPMLLPVYSDEQCQYPLVVSIQLPTCPAQRPKYVTPWIDPLNTCAHRGHVFTVGAEIQPGLMYTMVGGDLGGCAPYDLWPGSMVFGLGPEVPPSEFVGSEAWHH